MILTVIRSYVVVSTSIWSIIVFVFWLYCDGWTVIDHRLKFSELFICNVCVVDFFLLALLFDSRCLHTFPPFIHISYSSKYKNKPTCVYNSVTLIIRDCWNTSGHIFGSVLWLVGCYSSVLWSSACREEKKLNSQRDSR